MENSIRVYIGIVSYNSSEDLLQCLQSLEQQTITDFEVYILDNASSDQTISLLRKYTGLPIHLIINDNNVGFARAHNQIISHCRLDESNYYVVLNPDVILMPGYLEQLLVCMQDTKAGWGTGKLLCIDSFGMSKQIVYSVGHGLFYDGYVFNIGQGMPDNGQWNTRREIWGAPATALMISSSLIQMLAELDSVYEEQFFLYNEDTDFDWKARNLGKYCYYTPNAIAYHRGSNPTEPLRLQAVGNRYLSTIKNASLYQLTRFVLPMMLFHTLVRCILTPHEGLQLVSYLRSKVSIMISKRQQIPKSFTETRYWLQWSQNEQTLQPRSLVQRIQSFRSRHRQPIHR
jgi:GT2 family glycosyltransferase